MPQIQKVLFFKLSGWLKLLGLIAYAGFWHTHSFAGLREIAENLTDFQRRGMPIESFELAQYSVTNYGAGIDASPFYHGRFPKITLPLSYNGSDIQCSVTINIHEISPQLRQLLRERHGNIIPNEGEGNLQYRVLFSRPNTFLVRGRTEADRLILRPQHEFSPRKSGEKLTVDRDIHSDGACFVHHWNFTASMKGSEQGFSLFPTSGNQYTGCVHTHNTLQDPTDPKNYVLSSSGPGAGMMMKDGDPTFFQDPEKVATIKDFWSIAVKDQNPASPTTSVTDIHITPFSQEIIKQIFDRWGAPRESLNFLNFLGNVWPDLSLQSQRALRLFDNTRATPLPSGEGSPFQVLLSASSAPLSGTRLVSENGYLNRTIIDVAHQSDGQWRLTLEGNPVDVTDLFVRTSHNDLTLTSIDFTGGEWVKGIKRDNIAFVPNTPENRDYYSQLGDAVFHLPDGRTARPTASHPAGDFIHLEFVPDSFRATPLPSGEGSPFQVLLSASSAPLSGTRLVSEDGYLNRTIIDVAHQSDGQWRLTLEGPPISFRDLFVNMQPQPEVNLTSVNFTGAGWINGVKGGNTAFVPNTPENRDYYFSTVRDVPFYLPDGRMVLTSAIHPSEHFIHLEFYSPPG